MRQQMSRKAFFGTLGVAGLGIGAAVTGFGRPSPAFAQESDDTDGPAAEFDPQAMKLRFYQEFTAALASELSLASADEVDPAIRAAWNTVIDGLQGDGLITAGQATAVKSLIATAEVPVGPGPMFGPRHGMMGHGMPGGPGGPDGPAAPAAPATDGAVQAEVVEIVIEDRQAIGQRFYPDFTAALATELGAGSADEVDGAIRLAMFSVIDSLASDETIPAGAAEFMKAKVATAEAPLGPGLMFGPPPFAMMRGMHGEGHGPMFGDHGEDGRGRGQDGRGRGQDGRGRGDDDGGRFGPGGDEDDASETTSDGSPEAEDEVSS